MRRCIISFEDTTLLRYNPDMIQHQPFISSPSLLIYKLITIQKMPVNKDDFDEPDWEKILTTAFPEWERPKAGCPRLDSLSGNITEGFTEFPVYEEGKWNPCYYTKAFAGLGEL